jgi:hypothetical protein
MLTNRVTLAGAPHSFLAASLCVLKWVRKCTAELAQVA